MSAPDPRAPSASLSLRSRLLTLILLACGLGAVGPAESYAQSSSSPPDSVQPSTAGQERGRRAALQAARKKKSENLTSADRAVLEQFLLWIEDERILQKIGSVAGVRKEFRVGPAGLGSGSGLGLRLTYVPFPQRPNLDVRANVGGTLRGYWRLGGSVGYKYHSVFGHLYSQVKRRPQRTYFLNLENTTGSDNRQQFDITNWTSGGVLGVRLLPSLSLAASSSYLSYTPQVNAATLDPQDPGILNPATSTRYLTTGGHLQLDRRNVTYNQNFGNRFVPSSDNLTDRPLNPESGTLLSLNVTWFHELTDANASFHQAEAELQQYASFYNGYHTFALRHRTVFTGPENATVPFYQLPYVGGDFTLRGYDEFRFRGPPHGLLYNLEYRYKVWHHADMVLFGDAGKVFDDVHQWGFTDLRYSYGVGLRFITARSAYFRIGVAFSKERRPRFVFKFSNVF